MSAFVHKIIINVIQFDSIQMEFNHRYIHVICFLCAPSLLNKNDNTCWCVWAYVCVRVRVCIEMERSRFPMIIPIRVLCIYRFGIDIK